MTTALPRGGTLTTATDPSTSSATDTSYETVARLGRFIVDEVPRTVTALGQRDAAFPGVC